MKTCKKCKEKENWKAERAHHCKVAKACIPKMDHYCPFTLTTVGYSNHKAFVLFCVYHTIGIFYLLLFISRWIYTNSILFYKEHNLFLSLLFFGIIVFDLFALIGFLSFTFTMSLAHIDFIVKNITTLDNLSFLDPVRSRELPVNQESRFIWNLGFLYNLKVVGLLEPFWWIPRQFSEKYEGYHWNRFDKPREQIECKGENSESKEEYMRKARKRYHDYTIVFGGQGYKVSDFFH